VICSLLILTFSRISYTLTISQNNNIMTAIGGCSEGRFPL